MQRNKSTLAAVLIGLAVHAGARDLTASASASQPQPGYGFAPTVKKLMQIEADKAVAAAMGQSTQLAPAAAIEKAAAAAAPESKTPELQPEPRPVLGLKGIYGHGGRWTAEVAIDGRVYAFSAKEIKAGYKATRIDARCIELQHAKFPQKLCSDR